MDDQQAKPTPCARFLMKEQSEHEKTSTDPVTLYVTCLAKFGSNCPAPLISMMTLYSDFHHSLLCCNHVLTNNYKSAIKKETPPQSTKKYEHNKTIELNKAYAYSYKNSKITLGGGVNLLFFTCFFRQNFRKQFF